MEMTRPGYAVVYIIILCALANGGSHGKRWNPEEFLNDGSPTSFHEDADKVQEAWKHCMEELKEQNIVKSTESLPPQTQQILLDCLRTKTSNVVVSEEKAGSRPLLTRYLTSGLGRHLLADSPSSSSSPSPASSSSPSSSLSPSSSSSPSPSPASSSSPSPTSDDEKPADSSSKDNSFDSNLPPNMFAPFPPPPPSPKLPPPKPLVYAPPEPKHDDFQVQLIVFVVAVAVCAVSAILLIYICCGKQQNQKVDPKEAHKDDSPLLTVSSADHAFAASEKFAGWENSEKNESSTMVRNMSAKPEEHSSLAETSSSGGIGKVPAPPLKPPPAAPPPPGPPPPPAPRAPPPPRGAKAPPVPKPMHGRNKSSDQGSMSDGGDSDKPKLKPFFWDKVNAKVDQGMVWHQINAGSFQFNEEMMESLFGCANQNKNERKRDEPAIQYIQVIDPRKAQNLSILLRALNVTTEEVIDALKQGNEIPGEIIHTLLRMAPTQEEELKLRLFKEELNRLGPAERFLKVLVDIPFAFKRLESLMFMGTMAEEASNLRDYFATLEVACNKLRKSRLFLKLLEAVLKTGNRMNDGTYRGGAQAFKLDTLLKLSDVKGIDGKTTLLHFVVLEIIRSEGVRAVRAEKGSQPSIGSVKTEDFHDEHHTNEESAADHYRRLGLQVVSGLSGELEDVKKAAVIDGEGITASVSKLGQSLLKSKEFLNNEMKDLDEDSEFHRSLKSFVEKAEEEVTWLLEEEKRIMALVKNTGDYFHGTAGKDEGLRLFVVVRDFLVMLDKACKEVQDTTMKASKASKKETQTTTATTSPKQTRQPPENDIHRRLFPTIAGRRVGFSDSDSDSDSDDESLSP